MAASGTSTTNQDHALQVIKKYRNYVAMIVEPNIRKLFYEKVIYYIYSILIYI